jgi:hypothetical protein
MNTVEEFLNGLPATPEEYTREQLTVLFNRYSEHRTTLPSNVVEAVRALGMAATERLNAEKEAVSEVTTPEVTAPEVTAPEVEKVAPIVQPPTRLPGAPKNGKPGVLKAIEEIIRAEALTKEEVVERLAIRFPTRDKTKMATSTRAMLQGGFVRKGLNCTYEVVDNKCLYKIT